MMELMTMSVPSKPKDLKKMVQRIAPFWTPKLSQNRSEPPASRSQPLATNPEPPASNPERPAFNRELPTSEKIPGYPKEEGLFDF